MTGCSIDVAPGDTVTWLDGVDERDMLVKHVELGTAHMCLIVGDDASVWDWQVTKVNGELVA